MQSMDMFQDLLISKASLTAGENAYTKFKIDDYIPEKNADEKQLLTKKTIRKVIVENESEGQSGDASSWHSSPRTERAKEVEAPKITDPVKLQEE